MAFETTFIHDREVPETYHDALRKILKGLKKKKITPEPMLDASTYDFESGDHVYSVFGYFLNEAEVERVNCNEQVYDTLDSAKVLRKYLGVNKLELQTIFSMNTKDLDKIIGKYAELMYKVDAYMSHYTNKGFKRDMKEFVKNLLATTQNYENPGYNF